MPQGDWRILAANGTDVPASWASLVHFTTVQRERLAPGRKP
jgi:hypothetical protein